MAAKKKKATASHKGGSSRNLVPLYILIIMALATALVMVLNSQGGKTLKTDKPAEKKETAAATAPTAEPEKKPEDAGTPDAEKKDAPAVKKKVKLYYLNENTGKILTRPVIREVEGTDPLAAALTELVKPLSSADEKRGLITAMPEGLKLRSVTVRNGIAEIDLSQEFFENAMGDFLTGRLNQFFYTAIQFPGVKAIAIRINGKPMVSNGGDGLPLSWPMKKAF